MTPYHSQHNVTIYCDDCVTAMQNMEDNSIDAIVTDPPYGLSKQPDIVEVLTHWLNGDDYEHTGGGFMNKGWDSFVPAPSVWRECLRVLKPGGHLLAFAGTRTVDLMGISLRLGGFEIRDMVAWVFGQGFPKSLDIGKQLDRIAEENNEAVNAKIECGKWLKRNRENLGFSLKDVAKHFLSNTNGLTGCVSNWENGKIPTWEHYSKLKKILNLDDSFDYLIEDRPKDWIEAEREVVGNKVGYKAHYGGAKPINREYNITAPATPEAQQWEGFGTGLKPALSPILLCRKPISEKNIAANVLRWGTGGLAIDKCRVGDEVVSLHNRGKITSYPKRSQVERTVEESGRITPQNRPEFIGRERQGRFPANLILSDDDEVRELFPETGKSRTSSGVKRLGRSGGIMGKNGKLRDGRPEGHNDSGSAARFFYCAKSSKAERNAGLEEGVTNTHETVKPLALMRYLCRLITPPNGLILDPFAGSGSTLIAAREENFKAIGVELEEDYCQIAVGRLSQVQPNLFNVGD